MKGCALFVLAVVADVGALNCANGCAGERALVCGSDGRTYHSACIAECQGVTVVSNGPCAGTTGKEYTARGTSFSKAHMDRFKNEGFKLVGSANIGHFDPSQGTFKTGRDQTKPMSWVSNAKDLLEMRVSVDGLVYATDQHKPNLLASTVTVVTAPYIPAQSTTIQTSGQNNADQNQTAGQRKVLTIFGADDRVQITTTAYPRSAGGLIEFTNNGLSYICSGSMISARTMLTAAHCLYSRSSGKFNSGMTFSPGRLSSSNKPYGSYSWSWYGYFTGWVTSSIIPWPLDMAAIRFTDATVGSRTGYFGLSMSNVPYTLTIKTEGYPGDKTFGTYWTWSNVCSTTDTNAGDGQMYFTCDIKGGQSGSPVYYDTATGPYIRGVVSWENPSTNGACELTASTYPAVVGWR